MAVIGILSKESEAQLVVITRKGWAYSLKSQDLSLRHCQVR